MTTTTTKTTKKSNKPQLKTGAIEFTLTIPHNQVKQTYTHVIQELAKNVEVKGFRKGKAPLNLVKAKLDPSKVYSHVLDHLIPTAYSQALHKHNYKPIIEPRITPISMEEGKDWQFKVETAEAPEVKVGKYLEYIKKALHQTESKTKTNPKQKNNKNNKKQNNLDIVLRAIIKHSKVNPAPILVDYEAKAMIRKLESQLAQLKLKLDDYLKSIKKTRQDLEKEYQQTAYDNIVLEFSLQKIIELEKPEISKAELTKANPPKGQENYIKYLLQKQKLLDKLAKL